jgi:hypothetical protein
MNAEITGDSPQAIAYKLLEIIALQQDKNLLDRDSKLDKAWILSTYKECIEAVLEVRRWGPFAS